jgi:hypothetical protein
LTDDRPSTYRLSEAAKLARDTAGHSINLEIPEALMTHVKDVGYLSQLLMVSIALNMQDTDDEQLKRNFKTALEDAANTHQTLYNIDAF